MESITLRTPQGAEATVYLHGAHVTSWRSSDGEVKGSQSLRWCWGRDENKFMENLFVSKQAIFSPPKAIRGGIPLCFPQFGKLGPLGQHGFARNSAFTVVSQDANTVVLQLTPSTEQLKDAGWSHPFRLTVKVSLATDGTNRETLTQTLEAVNLGEAAFDFTAALHTYFAVSAIDKVKVLGLDGLRYLDNTQGMKEGSQSEGAVSFSGELDRIYVKTPDSLQILDEGRRRTITLHKKGLPDAVVWNPWIDKAKGMADFGDDEYQVMVCLEPALAASGPVRLQTQQTWTAEQVLSVQKAT